MAKFDVEKYAMVALLRIFSEPVVSVLPRWAQQAEHVYICTFCGASLESTAKQAWTLLNHSLGCPVLQAHCLLKKWDSEHE